jgi:catechol 2,3-dioxygenase
MSEVHLRQGDLKVPAERAQHMHLALDGKTLRGPLGHEAPDQKKMHQLVLYEMRTGLLLKEQVVGDKQNELSIVAQFLTKLGVKEEKSTMNTMPLVIGHVHLKVRDLNRAIEFYTKILGLSVSERVSHYAFLTFGNMHHNVALNEVGLNAELPKARAVGLYHFAIEVPTISEFKAFYHRLKEANVEIRPVDHYISKALYFRDPDGNGIEIYVDTRAQNARYDWRGENGELDVDALLD